RAPPRPAGARGEQTMSSLSHALAGRVRRCLDDALNHVPEPCPLAGPGGTTRGALGRGVRGIHKIESLRVRDLARRWAEEFCRLGEALWVAGLRERKADDYETHPYLDTSPSRLARRILCRVVDHAEVRHLGRESRRCACIREQFPA